VDWVQVGLLQSVVVTPVEGIKCRLQGQRNKDSYKGTVDCAKKIYKAAGVRGVWSGFVVTMARDTPSFGVYFWAYEYGKRHVFIQEGQKRASKFGMFMAGGMAGVLGWLVSYPLDVIKSRIQMDSLKKPRYKGIIDCAKKSYKESGWRVFFKGLGATLARGFIVNGTTFLGYEFSLSVLHKFC